MFRGTDTGDIGEEREAADGSIGSELGTQGEPAVPAGNLLRFPNASVDPATISEGELGNKGLQIHVRVKRF